VFVEFGKMDVVEVYPELCHFLLVTQDHFQRINSILLCGVLVQHYDEHSSASKRSKDINVSSSESCIVAPHTAGHETRYKLNSWLRQV